MKKLLVGIVVIILIAAVGIGGYEIGSHKIKITKATDTATSSTPKSTPKTATTDTKPLNLQAVLTNMQKQYPTVQQSYLYTQNRDPNGNLGKAGYYTAGAEFYDTRTNTPPDGDAFGADSGGAIEVYANTADAAKRIDYLKQFQGNPALDPGAAKQVGKVVVRASSKYTAADQAQMINYLTTQVQAE